MESGSAAEPHRRMVGGNQGGALPYPAMKAAELGGRNPQVCYAAPRMRSSVFSRIRRAASGHRPNPTSGEAELMRWDSRTGTLFTKFPAPRIPGAAADDLVSAFAEDRQGNIWMGLSQGRFVSLRRPRFPVLRTEATACREAASSRSWPPRCGLWIGSNGGLGHVVNTADGAPADRDL